MDIQKNEKEGKDNGFLISILSFIGAVIGAVIVLGGGVFIQIYLYGSGGPESPGVAIVLGSTFGAYYFIKKVLKKYFKRKFK